MLCAMRGTSLFLYRYRMKDAGFYTVSSVLMKTKKALCEIKGLSEPKIDKIRDAALKLFGAGFITGTEARQKRMNVYHVSTGSQTLNEIIGGGIESGSITEAFGKFFGRNSSNVRRHTLLTFSDVCLVQLLSHV